jgi:glycosyltransferase involved in cell wall biosynthesis
LLEEIATVDSRVLVIKLRRNFGQTPALAAGFDNVSGDFIFAMDGDLQHDPNEIARFIEARRGLRCRFRLAQGAPSHSFLTLPSSSCDAVSPSFLRVAPACKLLLRSGSESF